MVVWYMPCSGIRLSVTHHHCIKGSKRSSCILCWIVG